MDAKKISTILDDYKAGRTGTVAASLALVLEGCDSDEVIALLEAHKPENQVEETQK